MFTRCDSLTDSSVLLPTRVGIALLMCHGQRSRPATTGADEEPLDTTGDTNTAHPQLWYDTRITSVATVTSKILCTLKFKAKVSAKFEVSVKGLQGNHAHSNQTDSSGGKPGSLFPQPSWVWRLVRKTVTYNVTTQPGGPTKGRLSKMPFHGG